MANIIDYLEWRGDIHFCQDSFNEIDALILSQIVYIDFENLVSQDFNKTITLSELAKKFSEVSDFEKRCNIGAFFNKLTVNLLLDAGKSNRFSNIKICGYRVKFDLQKEEQFCAITFLLDKKTAFICFRGTDDTIIGLKEDFNMGKMETIPAQEDAVLYLEDAIKSFHKKIIVGGHSKGGNLAIFASAKVCKKYKNKIIKIYNNDGPGFRDEILSSKDFQNITEKVFSFYPQLSIVGVLFSNIGKRTIVKSEQNGIMQHDPFSWHLKGNKFITQNNLDDASEKFHNTFNTWFRQLNNEQRSKFIDTLFFILEATDAKTASELEKNWLKKSTKILQALTKLDNDARENVIKTIQLLFQIAHNNFFNTKKKN